MNIINYYNYEITFDHYLKLEIRVAMKYGPDTFYFSINRNLDVFFFIGNPTLILKEGIGIRHLLPKL